VKSGAPLDHDGPVADIYRDVGRSVEKLEHVISTERSEWRDL